MRIIFCVTGILIAAFGISFSMLNAGKVSIHYYIGSTQIPLSILLVTTLGAGILLGILLMFLSWIRLKRTNISLKHQLKLARISYLDS